MWTKSGRTLVALLASLALAACGDSSSGPGPGATAGTVRGVITSSSGLGAPEA